MSLGVPDSVRFTLLALAAHLPFPGRGVELSGVLYVHEGSGSDDAKVREVDLRAVKHLECRLHLERRMRSPVLEVRRHHEQLPHMDDGKPLSGSMHQTMAHRALLTRLDTRVCCGVFEAVNS